MFAIRRSTIAAACLLGPLLAPTLRAEAPQLVYYNADGERVSLAPSPRYLLLDRQAPEVSNANAAGLTLVRSAPVAKQGLMLLRRPPDIEDFGALLAVSRFGRPPAGGIALARGDVDVLLVNEFIVRFESARHAERLLRSSGASVLHRSRRLDHWYLVQFPGRNALEGLAAINELAAVRGVRYAYPNFVVIETALQQDPDAAAAAGPAPPALPDTPAREQRTYPFDESWPDDFWFRSGHQRFALDLIRAPEAWRITTGACDVSIAILDDGVDTRHEDLAPKVVAAVDVVDDDADPRPNDRSDWHGTAVAGVAAAAAHNDGIGIAGTSWGSGIIAVRIFESDTIERFSQPAQVQLAFEKALDLDADILNSSWGFGDEVAILRIHAGVEEVIEDAVEDGKLFVFAAGNGSGPAEWPARLAAGMDVISVGSTDVYGVPLANSKSGPDPGSVTLLAPGRQVVTTGLSASYGSAADGGGDYILEFEDSSAAAAFVSGAAALLLSWHPDATPAELRDWLVTGAADTRRGDGLRSRGVGRLDIRGALEAAGTDGIELRPVPTAPLSLAPGQSKALRVAVRRHGVPLGGAILRVRPKDPGLLRVEPSDSLLQSDCDGQAVVRLTAAATSPRDVETGVTVSVHTASATIPVFLSGGRR